MEYEEISKSYLVPKREQQQLNIKQWREHTSADQKWELWDGIPFETSGLERDRLLICLLYSSGLQHLIELLPTQSKQILRDLLKET